MRANDPTVKALKKAYAQKPEVKSRKKELAQLKRLQVKALKAKHPSIYEEITAEIAHVNGSKNGTGEDC